jgi:hypothetical protein
MLMPVDGGAFCARHKGNPIPEARTARRPKRL